MSLSRRYWDYSPRPVALRQCPQLTKEQKGLGTTFKGLDVPEFPHAGEAVEAPQRGDGRAPLSRPARQERSLKRAAEPRGIARSGRIDALACRRQVLINVRAHEQRMVKFARPVGRVLGAQQPE